MRKPKDSRFVFLIAILSTLPWMTRSADAQTRPTLSSPPRTQQPLAARAMGIDAEEIVREARARSAQRQELEVLVRQLWTKASNPDAEIASNAKQRLKELGTKIIVPLLDIPLGNDKSLDPVRHELLMQATDDGTLAAPPVWLADLDRIALFMEQAGPQAPVTLVAFAQSALPRPQFTAAYCQLVNTIITSSPHEVTRREIAGHHMLMATKICRTFWATFSASSNPNLTDPAPLGDSVREVVSLGVFNCWIPVQLRELEQQAKADSEQLTVLNERRAKRIRMGGRGVYARMEYFRDAPTEGEWRQMSASFQEADARLCLHELDMSAHPHAVATAKRLGLETNVPKRDHAKLLKSIADRLFELERYAIAMRFYEAYQVQQLNDDARVSERTATTARIVLHMFLLENPKGATEFVEDACKALMVEEVPLEPHAKRECMICRATLKQLLGLGLALSHSEQESNQHYSPGVDLLIEACENDPVAIVENFHRLGQMWVDVGHPELALKSVSYSKDRLPGLRKSHPKLVAETLHLVTSAGVDLESADKVASYADEAVRVAEEGKLGPAMLGKSHCNRGIVLYALKKYPDAVNAFEAAALAYSKASDVSPLELATLDHHAALAKLRIGAAAEAVPLARSAFAVRLSRLGVQHRLSVSSSQVLAEAEAGLPQAKKSR